MKERRGGVEGGQCREDEYRTASTSCLRASKEEEEVEGGTVNSNCLPLNGICNKPNEDTLP